MKTQLAQLVEGHGYPGKRVVLAEATYDVAALAQRITRSAELQGRVTSVASIVRKMQTRRLGIEGVLDSVGIRVVVHTTAQCYALIDRLRERFETIAGEDNDYILVPKPSGYRALHVTIIGIDEHPVEVQVQTRRMHGVAQRGGAAHAAYAARRTRIHSTRPAVVRTPRWPEWAGG